MKVKIEISANRAIPATTIIEVKLPVYRKDTCHFYKVFSDKHCICVYESSYGREIGQCSAALAWDASGSKESTREEFETAYKEVSKELEAAAL